MARFYMATKHLEEASDKDISLKYYVLAENTYYEDLDLIKVSYGIEIEKIEDGNFENTKIRNITCDKEKMRGLKDILIKNKVLPIQLEDVIIDILY